LSGRESIPPNKKAFVRSSDTELSSSRAAVVRVLTQEQLVRKAVVDGVGRAVRQVHTEEQVGAPTEHITLLLAQLSNDEPIDVAPGSFTSEARPTGLRTLRRASRRSR
jgi:hypothetical protein